MKRIAGIVVTAGMALLAAACGGPPQSHVARQNGAIAFSQCMRTNGVSHYPDPEISGALPKESLQQLGVSSARFQSAQRACRHLLPNGGRPPSQDERQRARAQALRFSQCVRAHGVTNFPDPGSDGRIPDPAGMGIDQGSPSFQAANQACRNDRPPYIPSNAAYDSWARTHGG
jgi:hypothetical protein